MDSTSFFCSEAPRIVGRPAGGRLGGGGGGPGGDMDDLLHGSGWSVMAPPGTYTFRLKVPGAAPVEREITLTTAPFAPVTVGVP